MQLLGHRAWHACSFRRPRSPACSHMGGAAVANYVSTSWSRCADGNATGRPRAKATPSWAPCARWRRPAAVRSRRPTRPAFSQPPAICCAARGYSTSRPWSPFSRRARGRLTITRAQARGGEVSAGRRRWSTRDRQGQGRQGARLRLRAGCRGELPHRDRRGGVRPHGLVAGRHDAAEHGKHHQQAVDRPDPFPGCCPMPATRPTLGWPSATRRWASCRTTASARRSGDSTRRTATPFPASPRR